MIIQSVKVRYPSLRISNSNVLQEIAQVNRDASSEVVRRTQHRLQRWLEAAGSEYRFVRDKDKGETAMPFISSAIEEALAEAEVAPEDVDLVIYCGVGRGFIEPAMAYLICKATGMACECFDVLDACMGWVRALYLAYSLFRSGSYSRVVIVNGEFNIYESGYPEILRLGQPEKWRYTYPALTIGEAASATVLSKSDRNWNFHFRSDPSRSHLCTLPLPSYGEYPLDGEQLARNGPQAFMSLGTELSAIAVNQMVDFVHQTYPDTSRFDIWFPHVASMRACRESARQLGLGDRLYTDGFPKFGNVVSASIPAAMDLALHDQKLKRGNNVVLCPASAGMSYALVDFVF